MSRVYMTRDGEMLDAIAARVYGSEAAVHDIIDANPGISSLPERLPAGVQIVLPDIQTPVGAPKTVRLWGQG